MLGQCSCWVCRLCRIGRCRGCRRRTPWLGFGCGGKLNVSTKLKLTCLKLKESSVVETALRS
jgi:hypothetical protein